MGNKHKLLITFTERQPKGIRANVKLSKDITERGIGHVHVSINRDQIIIRPAIEDKSDKYNFKVSYVAGGVVFIAAAALFDELQKRELLGKKVVLAWSARKAAYEGDLSNVQATEEEQISIQREKGVEESPLLRLSVKPVLSYKGIKQTTEDQPDGNH